MTRFARLIQVGKSAGHQLAFPQSTCRLKSVSWLTAPAEQLLVVESSRFSSMKTGLGLTFLFWAHVIAHFLMLFSVPEKTSFQAVAQKHFFARHDPLFGRSMVRTINEVSSPASTAVNSFYCMSRGQFFLTAQGVTRRRAF